ncbi:hypothetical protein RUND412_001758 [Rhizina undulata]
MVKCRHTRAAAFAKRKAAKEKARLAKLGICPGDTLYKLTRLLTDDSTTSNTVHQKYSPMDCSVVGYICLVESLIAKDANAQGEIVTFTRLIPREPPPEAGPDCAIPKLEGLRWGLAKYGYNVEEGGSFFGSLKSIAWFLLNGLLIDPIPLPRLDLKQ